jgi:hypothetical protein
MQLHGNYASRAFDDILSVVAQSGREGWDEIAKLRKIKDMFLMFIVKQKLLML